MSIYKYYNFLFLCFLFEILTTEASQKENKSSQPEDCFQQCAAVSEAGGQKTELETQPSVGTQTVTSFFFF